MKTEEEYWKITNLKKYLIILVREDKLKCEVTQSEENDVTTKIKLMQEAEKHGREQERARIKEEIKKLSKTGDEFYNDTGRNWIYVEELLKVLEEK